MDRSAMLTMGLKHFTPNGRSRASMLAFLDLTSPRSLPTSNVRRSRLLELPAELRILIYEWHYRVNPLKLAYPRFSLLDPLALVKVNRKLRSEYLDHITRYETVYMTVNRLGAPDIAQWSLDAARLRRPRNAYPVPLSLRPTLRFITISISEHHGDLDFVACLNALCTLPTSLPGLEKLDVHATFRKLTCFTRIVADVMVARRRLADLAAACRGIRLAVDLEHMNDMEATIVFTAKEGGNGDNEVGWWKGEVLSLTKASCFWREWLPKLVKGVTKALNFEQGTHDAILS